jgi:hypothetical protein
VRQALQTRACHASCCRFRKSPVRFVPRFHTPIAVLFRLSGNQGETISRVLHTQTHTPVFLKLGTLGTPASLRPSICPNTRNNGTQQVIALEFVPFLRVFRPFLLTLR